jgi:hypothetical protein
MKAIVNGKRIMMKSVTGDAKPLHFREFDLTPKEELEKTDFIKAGEYFLSDLAIDQSDTVYHSLKDDRFNEDVTKALVKACFGIGLGYGQHSSYVVSGLPINHFAKFKDNIKGMFMGNGQETHTFNVQWERVMGVDHMEITHKPASALGTVRTIEGRFLPQAHAAAMSSILDEQGNIADKVRAGKTIAVIDPGFGTTDVYVLSALKAVERLTFSTDIAMNTAYRLIANKIQDSFGVSLPLYKVAAVVRNGTFTKDGKVAPMKPVIDWAFKATAQQFLAELYNRWKNTHEIDETLVAGGGGKELYPYLMREIKNTSLLPNSQWAIAEGYDRWGRMTWKDAR